MRSTIAAIKQRIDATNASYFRALRQGDLTREEFVETQIQFFHAVAFFARPMAALAARLPRIDDRLPLVANISDEHGGGDPRFSHERTFLALLERLGVSEREVRARRVGAEVAAFNHALMGVCGFGDVAAAIAALGMIEDLFAELSATIGRAIVSRGWLTEEDVVHYATHETLDVQHCESFYRVLEGIPRAEAIGEGLELGAYVFMRLYADLFATRRRHLL